jgi:6-pyruvoyltetrahydropterin/6-carboxytetrahydropterin synthase
LPFEYTQFSTFISPWELHFNAAHFITYANVCENLHGHNFHARIDAVGTNTKDGFVIDLVLLNRLAAEVCATLNDCVLLPGNSTVVRIEAKDNRVEVESFGKRFLLPRENCLILPVSNTTAELIAWYISEELLKRLRGANALSNIETIEVSVEEADRQWGTCKRRILNE